MALRAIEPADSRLGLDAAGIVRRIGPRVQDLSVGDRVFAIGPGSFATSMAIPAMQCARLPDSLPLEEAATMPLAFATAIYSLMDLGQLKESQVRIVCSSRGQMSIAYVTSRPSLSTLRVEE